MASPGQVRQTTRFGGQVQGVGFRYQVDQFARNHAVTGFVENLPTGEVLLVLEGSRPEIASLVGTIHTHFAASIRHEQSEFSPATGEYPRFEIRR